MYCGILHYIQNQMQCLKRACAYLGRLSCTVEIHVNPARSGTALLRSNIVNIMVADTLAPCVANSLRYQQSWYWVCRAGKFLSYMRKEYNYLCHVSVGEWNKL